MAGDIEKHKKHLAVVSAEVVKRRMEWFRLKAVEVTAVPFICQSTIIRRPFTEYKKWLHPLEPVTLDDLKNWVGVPNELAKTMMEKNRGTCCDGQLWAGATNVTPAALPQRRDWDFRKLDNEEREAVRIMSKNLLYGYVTPESRSTPAVEGVVSYMLTSAKRSQLPIFVGQDLIVCPDNVVEFHGLAALYFNNILVYGNGKIKTSGTTKIHAVQIKRVP